MMPEEMTPDEAVEALEALRDAIPMLIFLIRLGQHNTPNEAVDAVDVTEDQDPHHTFLRPF